MGEGDFNSTEPHDWDTDGDRRVCARCDQEERLGSGSGEWLKTCLGRKSVACSGYKPRRHQSEGET